MLPTSKGYFANRAICPEIIASFAVDNAQQEAKNQLSEADKEWFIQHSDTWIRWFHANNKKWRAALERESNKDRDFVIAFVNHWAKAFLLNPETYKERHPLHKLT